MRSGPADAGNHVQPVERRGLLRSIARGGLVTVVGVILLANVFMVATGRATLTDYLPGDPGPDRENAAFTIGDDGEVVVLTCLGIEPDSVGVWLLGGDHIIGNSDDTLHESVSPSSYDVGPAGLLESAMTERFDGAWVLVEPGGGAELHAADVPFGRVVLTDGRNMTIDEYAELVAADDECTLLPQ